MADNRFVDAILQNIMGNIMAPKHGQIDLTRPVANAITGIGTMDPILAPKPGQIDLTRPVVQGISDVGQAAIPVVQQALAPPPAEAQPQETPVPREPVIKGEESEGSLRDLLVQLGIPLATAGIGVGFPDALAGAAGFQTGFVGEQQRQEERQEQKKQDLVKRIQGFEKESRTIAKELTKAGANPTVEEFFKSTREILREVLAQQGFTAEATQPKKDVLNIKDAPSAKNRADGSKLKQDGKVLAIAKDGQWVSP